MKASCPAPTPASCDLPPRAVNHWDGRVFLTLTRCKRTDARPLDRLFESYARLVASRVWVQPYLEAAVLLGGCTAAYRRFARHPHGVRSALAARRCTVRELWSGPVPWWRSRWTWTSWTAGRRCDGCVAHLEEVDASGQSSCGHLVAGHLVAGAAIGGAT